MAALDLGGDFGGGRRVMLETIPAVAVKRLEIRKSVGADRDGQGMGGQINLVTRSAFDTNSAYLVGSLSTGFYTSDNVPVSDNGLSWRGDFVYSNLFGANDQFGVLVSGAYRRKDRDQDRVNPGGWRYYDSSLNRVNPPEPNDGTTPWARSLVSHGYYNVVEHLGGLAKLEFRPNDSLRTSIQAQYFEQVDDEVRPDLLFNGGDPTAIAGDVITVENATISHRLQTWYIKKYVGNMQLNADWSMSDRSYLSVRGTYSESNWYEDAPRTEFRNTGIAYSQTIGSAELPPQNTVADADLASFLDTDDYTFWDLQHRFDDETEEVYELAADYVLNLDQVSPGLSLSTGVKWRKTDRAFDRDIIRYLAGPTSTLLLTDVLRAGTFSYVPPQSTYPLPFINQGSFFEIFNSINEGNPNLEPRVSSNYDISLEYYFDDGDSFAGIGYFYKDIRDDIFVRRTELDGGATVLNRPENAESATIQGIELSLVKNKLDFLPGPLQDFGLTTNLTFIDGEIAFDSQTSFDFREVSTSGSREETYWMKFA